MKIIKVKLGERTYEIIIGNRILGGLGKHIQRLKIGDSAYIITNAFLKRKYGKILISALNKNKISYKFRLIPDSERSKSIILASCIIQDLVGFDKNKRVFIIALGGGVVGDLAGFIASIYKRGVPYIQIPTTLLAQVDSSIGGKTAVDTQEAKNIIGAFYQPRLVLSDISLLSSLNLRQLRAGLAEVIKYAAIENRQLFSYLEKNHQKILSKEKKSLEFIVSRCSAIKAKVVEKDEKEKKGLRTILNFGHTLGHAIEAASNYKKYNHGEAITLGMLIAADISIRLKLLKDSRILGRIEKLIFKVGLPIKIKGISLRSIIKSHYHDKKFRGTKNRLVLLKDLGKVKVVTGVPLEIIKEALKKRF
jgi:3-dehydroquinate synthase